MSLKKSYKITKYLVMFCGLLLTMAMMCGCGKEISVDVEQNEPTPAEEMQTEETQTEENLTGDITAEEDAVQSSENSGEETFENPDETVEPIISEENDEAVNVLSVEEQIQLFVDNKDVWYLAESDKENSKIYYLVTDLDMNDRIEIVRCDYCALPEFCKNRFFEVSADYSTVEKMDYDVETMWSNGEENGTSHGIATAPLPINCFWNKAGNRTTYYYIIPTREHEEGVEAVTQMSLGVNNTGKVFTDFTGYANMDTETGEITYSDYNGFECTQEDFEKSGFISYTVESGWQCDSVTWQTVMLDETTDMFEKLLESYNAYAHNPVNREY